MKRILVASIITLAFGTTAMGIEIAISTQAGWWGQTAADREMKLIVDSVKGATVKLFDATQQAALADWVREHTNDGRPDLLILCGRFPTSIYPANNAQPEGSLAELFLDAGNCIINTGDWIFYVPSSGTNNGANGLVNMTDRSTLNNMSANDTVVAVTDDGKKYTPSLAITSTDRPFFLEQLGGDWYAELILAQNTAGNRADPAIIANQVTGGRIGIFYQVGASGAQDNLPRGKVISEWINNWYLPVVAGGGQAVRPVPGHKANDIPRDAALSWKPGQFANTHNVYLGTSFADVNTAKAGTLVSQGQTATIYKPTTLLEYGQTYYWRVDEINAPPSNTVFKGDVWSFTVEPYAYAITGLTATASSQDKTTTGPANTVNNSGLTNDLHSTVGDAMWLSSLTGAQPTWIQYNLGGVYKLQELWVWNHNTDMEMVLGYGIKDVAIEYSTDGTTWTLLKETQLARAPGLAGYAHNTVVTLNGVMARYVRLTAKSNWGGLMPQYGLSEVRFFHVPVEARSPVPAQNAGNVALDADLDWRPGREATSHQVFFSADRPAVHAGTAPAQTVITHGFDPGVLNFGTPYYWKVDEIGPTTYPGPIWIFTTREYEPIEDFESYTDAEGNRIYEVWIDGETNKTGSLVGLDTAVQGTFGERTFIRGGRQSMPFAYNNAKAPFSSETTRTFDATQDWTIGAANTLSLWFLGWPAAFVDKGDGAFTVAASGHDIWDAADDFRFVYKKLTGDGSITVKVDSLINTNAWTKAGVMIRESLEAGSPMMDMVISYSGAAFQWRPAQGASAVATNSPTVTAIRAPQWVKLTRTGNVFTAQYSDDGKTWLDVKNPTLTGTPVATTLVMPATVYIGLCVTSHDRNRTTVAQFSGTATTGNVTGAWQAAWIGVDADRTNDPAGLYVTVADSAGKSATVAHPNPAATNLNNGLNAWNEWKIALSDLAGVNLAKVKKLTVGVGDGKAGGAGMLYVDDIQFGGRPAPGAPLGLVASYSFENNAKDSSPNGFDGTVLGAPTYEPGLATFGTALKFNGTTDSVDLGRWAAFDFPGSFSLSVWANIGLWNSNWNHVMVGNRGESGVGWQLRRRDNNRIVFTTRGVGQDDEPRSSKDVTLNEWVHIAAVYDNVANTKTLYINGVRDASVATNPGRLAATVHNTYIGCRANSANTGVEGRFTGMLDEVKIYDIALTPAEVLKLAGK